MNLLILPRYTIRGGSSRYMLYDYVPYFKSAGFNCDIAPLLDDQYLHYILDSPTHTTSQKLRFYFHLSALFGQRLLTLLHSKRYEAVLVDKELLPYLPFPIEKWFGRRLGRLILTYDEASYLPYKKHPIKLLRWLLNHKIEHLITIAHHVIVWNNEIINHLQQYTQHITQLGLGFDLQRYTPKSYSSFTPKPLKIGWIGTPSGFKYLHLLDEVLIQLSQKHHFELVVVSSLPFVVEGVNVDNRPWSLPTEVADLMEMDIGVMPLPESEWASGKSGCKMLQYMAVATPAVVSPVGINAQVIQHGINGFVATTPAEWYNALDSLLTNASLRQQLGQTGRQYIERHHNQAQNAEKFIQIIQQVIQS